MSLNDIDMVCELILAKMKYLPAQELEQKEAVVLRRNEPAI